MLPLRVFIGKDRNTTGRLTRKKNFSDVRNALGPGSFPAEIFRRNHSGMGRHRAAAIEIGERNAAGGTTHRVEAPGDDAALLARFQAGDDAALVELFDRHDRRLFIYCLKVVGGREQAQDITQELWMRVVRLRERPRGIANPLGFFLKIARNLCLNHKAARRDSMSLADLSERSYPVEEGSEMEEIVRAALDELSFDHREVLILNVYCGYRLDEIAGLLGMSPEAIWKRASRARKELRTRVMKELNG
jgi:RNA polymerase sigma-70 factor (ECF subfamily)